MKTEEGLPQKPYYDNKLAFIFLKFTHLFLQIFWKYTGCIERHLMQNSIIMALLTL